MKHETPLSIHLQTGSLLPFRPILPQIPSGFIFPSPSAPYRPSPLNSAVISVRVRVHAQSLFPAVGVSLEASPRLAWRTSCAQRVVVESVCDTVDGYTIEGFSLAKGMELADRYGLERLRLLCEA